MNDETTVCTACGEPGRLVCAGCQRIFCVEHLERHFVMGYFYFCAECLASAEASVDTTKPRKARKKQA